MSEKFEYSVLVEPYIPTWDDIFEDLAPFEREVWTLDGKLHNHRGPAVVIRRAETGQVVQEEFYMNGKRHRENAPAFVIRSDTQEERHWYDDGEFHRIGGPAIEVECLLNGILTQDVWLQEGKIHREGAPARVCRNDADGLEHSIEYFENGERHRTDGGPALIERDLNEPHGVTKSAWYRYGKLHRADGGPALIEQEIHPTEKIVKSEWYRDGKLFRENGQPTTVRSDYDESSPNADGLSLGPD